mmetsp:Transcript_86876/g.137796  ORF Transcript_86876/g.137796 Transcript_86876/m.137796 type:complete len:403 (+) Transcript_86876:277-1485(+)
MILLLELANAAPIGPLGVGVDVHLHHARFDGVADVLQTGATASVEDEGDGLVAVAAQLLLDELLGVVQDNWLQAHIARCIDAVHVAEGRGYCEVPVGHSGQRLVDLPDLLGLRVETRGIHVRVVHTVLFATGDTQFHLQQQVDLGHALQVLLADGDVILQGFLGQIQHVGGEEGLTILLEIFLTGLNQTVEPWQPGLLAVVGVQDHWHAIQLGHLTHMERPCHGARDAGGVVRVVRCLASQELPAATAEGDHHGATGLLGGLHAGIHGGTANHVDARDGELVLLGVVQQVHQGLTGDHSRLHRGGHLGEDLLGHSLTHHLTTSADAFLVGSDCHTCCAHGQGAGSGTAGSTGGFGGLAKVATRGGRHRRSNSWGQEGLGCCIGACCGQGNADFGRHGFRLAW